MRSARAPAAGFKAAPVVVSGVFLAEASAPVTRIGAPWDYSRSIPSAAAPPARGPFGERSPDTGPVRSEVGRERAYRAGRLPGALHRPVPHARRPTANEADPTGDWYAFEKGAQKTSAATASPTSGRRASSPGSTRASTRTWPPPTSSCCSTARRLRTRRCSSSATSTASRSTPTSPTRRHSCTAST